MHDQDSNSLAVNRAIVAFSEGNVPGMLEQFEEDAKWRRSELLPFGGTREGREAIGELFTSVLERLGGRLHVLDLTVSATGEQVFADYTISPSSDPNAEGAAHVLTAFHVVLGKIREAREFVFRVKADASAL
ncbi:MAG: nuclear transport factor 2 family protein [Sandaracinaceae bacterium]|nr:nuclear transport factor 2 family protein [Sandaracinaceae bacterium]